MKTSAKTIFVKRLDLVMTSKSVSSKVSERVDFLSRLCEVTPQAARKWLTGKGMPDYDNMKVLAAKLDVSTSYLIGEINIKKLTKNESSSLKNSFRNGVMTIELTETVISNVLIAGDTAICHPCKPDAIDGSIFVLQSANKRFFRKLSYNDKGNLVIAYEKNGESIEDVYSDKNMIELFLSSLVGRVESFIRQI